METPFQAINYGKDETHTLLYYYYYMILTNVSILTNLLTSPSYEEDSIFFGASNAQF